MSEKNLKGLTAFCLVLAVIPFLVYVTRPFVHYKIPVFADQHQDGLTVEIINNQYSGLYFVPPGMSVNQLLEAAGMKERLKNNTTLTNGTKIKLYPDLKNHISILMTDMTSAAKISSGLAIDVNKATLDDLILIKGIGPVTAQKIIDLRERLHGIKDMRQLMAIKGIKEKRLIKIQKYLFVEREQK